MLKTAIDQMGRKVKVNFPPKRIVSLVPSQTELLFDLGLEQEIIGVTKFCIHPKEKCAAKTIVGGTKKLQLEKIKELQPDLIIANKEENEKADIEALEQHFPVWISDIANWEDTLQMVESIGGICDRKAEAEKMKAAIHQVKVDLQKEKVDLSVIYLIWQRPFMTVGGDTFINQSLCSCGFNNLFKNGKRYPEISLDLIREKKPDLLMLSSEPFPFKEKHLLFLQKEFPETRVILVDGEMFSWYGSRLLKLTAYLKELKNYL